MKRLFLGAAWLCLCVNLCHAQDRIEVNACVPVKNVEDAVWLARYEKEIVALEAKDAAVGDFACDALFVGSSSMRMWQTMQDDFAPLRVVNRGYGGASIRDLLYNYPRVVSQYQPRSIVFYAENDIIGSQTDLSISLCFDLHRVFFERLHRDFPQAHLYILSIKPSLARQALLPKHRTLNALLEEYALQTEQTTYLDVATPLLDAESGIRPALYLNDNLHLSAEGYKIWTAIIKPHLE
jgi:lysophospholipase L1-like esterase